MTLRRDSVAPVVGVTGPLALISSAAFRDIAAVLACSVDAARSRLRRAAVRLALSVHRVEDPA
jgi:hypothetical protein